MTAAQTGGRGPTRRLRVLFVGDDASSTEIAATLMRRLVGDLVEISTAGAQLPDPGGRSDEMLVAMGLNPTSEDRLSAGALQRADRVIVLGTDLDVARISGQPYEERDLGTEDLARRIGKLVEELFRPPRSSSGSRRQRPLQHLSRLRRGPRR